MRHIKTSMNNWPIAQVFQIVEPRTTVEAKTTADRGWRLICYDSTTTTYLPTYVSTWTANSCYVIRHWCQYLIFFCEASKFLEYEETSWVINYHDIFIIKFFLQTTGIHEDNENQPQLSGRSLGVTFSCWTCLCLGSYTVKRSEICIFGNSGVDEEVRRSSYPNIFLGD